MFVISRSHCFLGHIIAGIIRVSGTRIHVCLKGCGSCTVGGRRVQSTRLGRCVGRRHRVGRRRTIVSGLGSFGHRGSVGHTRDHRGVLSEVAPLSGPISDAGRVRFALRPSRVDKGSILAIRRLSGRFSDRILFHSVDFRVGHNRRITIVNSGKAKGAALLGVVGRMVTTSRNRFALKSGIAVNCCSRRRRMLRSSGAVFSRVSSSCPSLAGARVEGALTTFRFAKSRIFGRVRALDNKRGNHMSLTGLVLSRTGFLVLSRPAGRLSVASGRVLRRTLGGCDKAVLCMSRSHCFVGRATSQVLRLIGRAFIGCVKGCSCCLRGGRTLALTCTSKGRAGTRGMSGSNGSTTSAPTSSSGLD